MYCGRDLKSPPSSGKYSCVINFSLNYNYVETFKGRELIAATNLKQNATIHAFQELILQSILQKLDVIFPP